MNCKSQILYEARDLSGELISATCHYKLAINRNNGQMYYRDSQNRWQKVTNIVGSNIPYKEEWTNRTDAHYHLTHEPSNEDIIDVFYNQVLLFKYQYSVVLGADSIVVINFSIELTDTVTIKYFY